MRKMIYGYVTYVLRIILNKNYNAKDVLDTNHRNLLLIIMQQIINKMKIKHGFVRFVL
jgi:hypothetical protein